jgi:hypothetical protein
VGQGLAQQLQVNYIYFIGRWKEIYRRNVQENFPQLNSLSFILKAFPQYAQQLEIAAREMVLSGYDASRVDEFIRLYKRPCGDVRQLHLYRDMEVIDGAIRNYITSNPRLFKGQVGVQEKQPGNPVPRQTKALTSSEQRIQEILDKRKGPNGGRKT